MISGTPGGQYAYLPSFKIASEAATQTREPEVSGFGMMFSRRRVELPEGTLHAYLESSTETFCGLSVASLALFPNIDWPGGEVLTGRHCPRCGEATADV